MGASLSSKSRKAFLLAGSVLLASAVARAQPAGPDPAPAAAGPVAVLATSRHPLSAADAALLRQALDSARRGDIGGARGAAGSITDSLARRIATWQLVDSNADSLTFQEVEQARRDLKDWPRAARRRNAAEKLVEASGKSPRQIVEWFGNDEPQTPQGAMALASAYRSTGHTQKASELIRRWWRTEAFDPPSQRTMLTRFADVLTLEDHARRADMLLYGAQDQGARDLIPLLAADDQLAAQARIALKGDAANANDLVSALPAGVSMSPGVAFERAAYLRRRGLDSLAATQIANFPREVFTSEQADRVWNERRRLVLASLKVGDVRTAYAAAADTGISSGPDAAEAEFYAGWIALNRMQDPQRAERHFAGLEKIGESPITRGRALYWLGRTAELQQDPIGAQAYYAEAARHYTTFYGQLAAERLGQPLRVGSDPEIDGAERDRFEGRDTVQAVRVLWDLGQRDLVRVFVLALDDILPTAEEQAQLVDLARGYGEQDLSMRVVRAAAQRGFVLPGRGYPYRTPPAVADAPEPALVLAITRQESGFDPLVRSGVGARGMMQLMPATAQIVARRLGVDYAPSMLDEPDYNMRLGSTFLGQLVQRFSGSYVMAIAGYNAGPGRPAQWSGFCGDPRGGTSDPLDFIECIPFSETRNYVMRVMEGMQVYRAKLNGGQAPITLSSDLRRGGYAYPRPSTASVPTAATPSGAPPS